MYRFKQDKCGDFNYLFREMNESYEDVATMCTLLVEQKLASI